MIICISGLTGCGKNTVGRLVAKRLKLRMVEPTFKSIAAKQGISLLEFQKQAEEKHSIDRQFDAALLAEVGSGNCVVTTWLGSWVVKNADLKVWLYATPKARAARIAKRDGMNEDEAFAHVFERDNGNRKRYLDVYGIDIFDHSQFDLVINTEKNKPEDSAKLIIEAARKTSRGKKAGIKKPAGKKSKSEKKR
ncbi:MAG: cytidylate kinase family protein [Candidatus Anstonellaceae archaeon]